jgi:hypothetical protein
MSSALRLSEICAVPVGNPCYYFNIQFADFMARSWPLTVPEEPMGSPTTMEN